ncbi:hypothetical protein BDFB_008625, partial [Asbolus verrucosus]
SKLCLPREKLLLKKDAYPSIFPNLPSYLSEPTPIKRKDPSRRFSNYVERKNIKQEEQQVLQDQINNLQEVLFKMENSKLTEWITKATKDCIYFFKINFNENIPKLTKTVILKSNLFVRIIFNDVDIDTRKYEYLLGAQLLCDTYSKLENLLNGVYNLTEKNVTFIEIINTFSSLLNEFINGRKVEEIKASKLKLLVEQLTMFKFKKTNLNREGLKYPTEFSIHIAEIAYKVFTVITSEKYEAMFLKVPKKKAVLQTLILDLLQDSSSNNPTQCNCGRSSQNVIQKCTSVWSNILLNNYS